ncbi:MAG: MBOAT family protein [Candidatus Aminicenantes bacterium]|nr:MBOAT family protein [Candidatus Aminicenantes bacterium]
MIFTSQVFLMFFAVVFTVHFLLPHRFRWIFLLAASFYFYAFRNPWNLALLLLPTLAVYLIARIFENPLSQRRRHLLLALGLASGLSVLLVFKYTNFAGKSIFALISLVAGPISFTPLKIAYIVGISFYSFKLVSYLLEVYHRRMKPERHIGYFTLYVAFFPQLLAGPIDRAEAFIRELKSRSPFDLERISAGFQQVLWGLFKKVVIADRLALFVNEVFKQPDGQGLNLVFGLYFYAFQIYCDFSGYSDMAVGISRMLGYRSMLNFNAPYFSRNLSEFWNRWHISLSTWLRDYLFLPIAYATMRRIRKDRFLGIKVEAWGYCVGIFLTMFLGGLWHGAAWTFVAWGTLHGIYLVVGYATRKPRRRLRRTIGLNHLQPLRNGLQIMVTFHLVTFAWLFFRAESFSAAFHYLAAISLKPGDSGTGHIVFNLILLVLFILMEVLIHNRKRFRWVVTMPAFLRAVLIAAWICLILILAVDKSNEFIYFQF